MRGLACAGAAGRAVDNLSAYKQWPDASLGRTDRAAFIRPGPLNLAVPAVTEPRDPLEGFLEALQGFLSDLDGYYANQGQQLPAEPSWGLFASALTAATGYE